MVQIISPCPYCQDTGKVVKIGITKTGHQRCRCVVCGKSFQLGYTYEAAKPGVKNKIFELTTQGYSISSTKRALRISKSTVFRERKKNGLMAKVKKTTIAPDERDEREALNNLCRQRNELFEMLRMAREQGQSEEVITEITEKVISAKRLVSDKIGLISKYWPLPKKDKIKTVSVSGSLNMVFQGNDVQVYRFLTDLSKHFEGLKIVIH